jgi:UDP-N-acetylmuramate: L-alanyl-gamma-D-glutamyl-meso-diaminopimelate ligase
VFHEAFANAFSAADEVVIAAVFRSTLPDSERLSGEQLVADINARGRRARYVPEIDRIIQTIADEHRPGDIVVLMSNGSFGGIHGKLLEKMGSGVISRGHVTQT